MRRAIYGPRIEIEEALRRDVAVAVWTFVTATYDEQVATYSLWRDVWKRLDFGRVWSGLQSKEYPWIFTQRLFSVTLACFLGASLEAIFSSLCDFSV